MTVPYTAEVSNSGFRTSMRLLLRWKGSVYKLLWGECIVYMMIYAMISVIYRFALNSVHKKYFEDVVIYCKQYTDLIPVAFVLGFYVSVVVNRWWAQFMSLPWVDRMAVFLTSSLHGNTDHSRMMRRTIMRYISLSFTLCMISISPSVKKRFPSLQHVVNAGFIEDNEAKILENVKTPYNKYFMPLVWAATLLTKGRKEGLIKDDFALKTLLDEINNFRGGLGNLLNYDWVNIPLVYTQVVILAVYLYFAACLISRQYVERGEAHYHNLGVYFPLFTCCQFVFYMGWLKVAESLLNPMGDDDDDFSLNELIDRNLPVSYLIVDEMHSEIPDLIKDAYWDTIEINLPYTEATKHLISTPFVGSTLEVSIPNKMAEIAQTHGSLQTVQEIDENESLDKPSIDNPSVIESGEGIHHSRNFLRRSKKKNINNIIQGTVFSSSINSFPVGKSALNDFKDESIDIAKDTDQIEDSKLKEHGDQISNLETEQLQQQNVFDMEFFPGEKIIET